MPRSYHRDVRNGECEPREPALLKFRLLEIQLRNSGGNSNPPPSSYCNMMDAVLYTWIDCR